MISLLPYSVQDKRNLALEKLMQEVFNMDIKKFMLFPVQNCSDEILKELAEEYHVMGFEGWNLAKTREQKQNLIIKSLYLHSKKGTEKSIKEALKNYGVEAEIINTNRPSHFNLKLNASVFLEEEDIVKLIYNYKPATRILDLIECFLTQKGSLFSGGYVKTLETLIISTKEVINL